MIEITDGKKLERARAYLGMSIAAFVKASLFYQGQGHGDGAGTYGRMLAPLYREFRIKYKFWEVV